MARQLIPPEMATLFTLLKEQSEKAQYPGW